MRQLVSWFFPVVLLLLAAPAAHAGAYDELLAAAENGENATVFNFIRRGMDVNTTDPHGNSLLMIAARTGNLVLLDSLLKNRVNVNRRNRYGDTAVMLAAMQGHLEAVRHLVEHGAAVDGDGWTTLHYSVFRGNLELVRYLLGKGSNVEATAPNGQTTLMLAVTQSGRPEIVKLLLDAGADPGRTDADGLTALDHARKLGRSDAVTALEARK